MNEKFKHLYLNSRHDRTSQFLLVEKLVPRFFSYFIRCGAEPHDAEDYCQDFFVSLFKGYESFDKEKDFLPWAYKIARNIYLKSSVSKARLNIISIQDWMPQNSKDSFESAIDSKISLKKLLSELSPEKREVIELKHFQNLKFSEIAQIQNVSVGTVKSRMFYALKELKNEAGRLINE
jgi:RNA polymerase sigma-70 factor (ECF subfamily)